MNTHPNVKKILCYGDSNTWGQQPDRAGRYDASVRWTGVAQNLLGDGYEIIEEGLGGRTVNLEVPDRVGRNGKPYFVPCLISQGKLDTVVIMLGTNDLKKLFTATAESIKEGLSGLVDDVYANTDGPAPKILLISPIHIESTAPRFWEFYTDYYNEKSDTESRKLADALQSLCSARSLEFLDAAKFAKAGEDGIHLDLESCKTLGEAVAEKLRSML